eukprot:7727639-Pyramimonas_sp.AAC.1
MQFQRDDDERSVDSATAVRRSALCGSGALASRFRRSAGSPTEFSGHWPRPLNIHNVSAALGCAPRRTHSQ